MEGMNDYFGSMQTVGWLFQRGLAALYLVAFASALHQFPALLGERGLLPVTEFLKRVPFSAAPSLFYAGYSDKILKCLVVSGIIVSLLILFAITEFFPWWVSTVAWLFLWAVYLSITNVGQKFYSFGWESMLVEAGFFAAFIGPSAMVVPLIPLLILRWMLFRVELGAGLIKLRHDSCWRDLTCLYYHHETQPMPNPLSRYFHHVPKPMLRFGVAFSHFVQIGMPFALFAPQPYAAIAGLFIIAHQLILIVGGNYSWLNWLTVCLGITAFSDQMIAFVVPHLQMTAAVIYDPLHVSFMYALLAATVFLSIQPTLNLFSKNQLMNFSYNPLHLVNTYGAFGSMSRERFEVVIEGTEEDAVGPDTLWKEYEFKGKPGNIKRVPPQVAPYHLRLDWLMWFIPFSVSVQGGRIINFGYERWFVMFIQKLLEGDRQTLELLASNPFPERPPKFIRAQYYLYAFTDEKERRATGDYWKRDLLGTYLRPVTVNDINALVNRPLIQVR
jgi:hypothetical protein